MARKFPLPVLLHIPFCSIVPLRLLWRCLYSSSVVVLRHSGFMHIFYSTTHSLKRFYLVDSTDLLPCTRPFTCECGQIQAPQLSFFMLLSGTDWTLFNSVTLATAHICPLNTHCTHSRLYGSIIGRLGGPARSMHATATGNVIFSW
jgi:hypothetical protein